jgi:catechol 2,3-dioxygenase-like lactoylglutathione lyase family enzyme
MRNSSQEWKGVDHVQFACSDMGRTIAFWESIGMRCQLNLVLHNPERNHFMIDIGREQVISYWYWPEKELRPAAPVADRGYAGFYHLAFHVDTEEELEDMRQRVEAAGIEISAIHGRHLFDKSIYFTDPDGIQFEFAAVMFSLEGTVEHDGNGTLIPHSADVKMGNRTLDGPVHFETKYK